MSAFVEDRSHELNRRALFARLGAGAAAVAAARLWTPGVFADELEKGVRTPAMTEGPFYPDKLPLDTDNDLVIVNDALTPAVGEVTHLSGKILDARGEPLRNATIEIWQVDHEGAYIHSQGQSGSKRDKNFQGYGRFLTGSTGDYYFRTIKPVPYPGRTPHIHVKVKAKGREVLTTQIFVKNHPQNRGDGVLNGVRDAKARESVQVDFAALAGSTVGELTARFDILLGATPQADDARPGDGPRTRGGERGRGDDGRPGGRRGPRPGEDGPPGDGPRGGEGDEPPPPPRGERPRGPRGGEEPGREPF